MASIEPSTTVSPALPATRSILGAVLERSGVSRPYKESSPLVVKELLLGAPGPNEVVVQVTAASICHSDLSVVNGSRVRPMPMLLGHEAAGRIVETGDSVSGLEVGQKVVLVFLPSCGRCRGCASEGRLPCEKGSRTNAAGTLLDGGRRLLASDGSDVNHHLGVSGFASHCVVHESSVVPIDDDVPDEVAAMLGCAVLTGGGAVLNAAKPHDNESIAVVGMGGVGMAALITAAALELNTIIAIDTSTEKLVKARQLGATEAYTPQEAIEMGVSVDAVIEAAGSARAFETAFAVTAVGGRTVTVGLPAPDSTASLSPSTITSEARTIIGSYLGSAVPSRDIPRFAELWRQGSLPIEKLMSKVVNLEDINEALDDLADGKELRQIIRFQ